MADWTGQTWTNLWGDAFKFFHISNQTREFAVLSDEFLDPWTEDSAMPLPSFERICAKAWEFWSPYSRFVPLRV